ncbi:MAG: PKD domain-containing protein, partial [Flavobacteriales bacterium]|nr:PKD domain-containing protein [Flavobacteriales bacterium]
MTYQSTFFRLAIIICTSLLTVLPGKVEGQSVDCPQCLSGICEGDAVVDYLEFDNISTPIQVLSLTGDINGDGTDLENYTFSDNGFGEFVLSFEDSDGNLFEDITINVDVESIGAAINFNQVGNCFESTFSASVNSPGNITSYQWLITEITGGLSTPVGTLGGNNQSYNFPGSGIYELCLTVTSNGGCTEQICETQTVVGPVAGLAFLEDNNDELLTSPNDPNLIAYCNFTVNQDFDLFIADSSSHSSGGTIVNYLVELDGVEIYNSSEAPDDLLIVAEDGDFSGYVDVYIEVVDANGCIDSNTYNVYLGTTVEPQLNTAPPTSILCPGDVIPIETTSWQSNPEGVDYGIVITCDPDDENAVLESWSWSAEDPDDEIYWTPDESSCGCSENSYWAVSSASHPCNTSAIADDVDFKVSFPSEATFTQTPSGNLCDDEMATFTWDFANLVVDGVPHCEAALEWSITDLDGNSIPINGAANDQEMSHTFDGPNTYEVCLQVYSNCGEPTYCETVCVNPPITDVTLNPEWNTPSLLCPGDEFTSELTYSD